jgi:hypothetical protein
MLLLFESFVLTPKLGGSAAKQPRGAQREYVIEPKGMFLVRAKTRTCPP